MNLSLDFYFSGQFPRRKRTAQRIEKPVKRKPVVQKEYIKDVYLLPSPNISVVPRGNFREQLYDEGFVVSWYKLISTASESKIYGELETAFFDKLRFVEFPTKFDFVRAIGKKIVSMKNIGDITGEILKHICGPRDRPIYIRSNEDITYQLTSCDNMGEFCKSEFGPQTIHYDELNPSNLETTPPVSEIESQWYGVAPVITSALISSAVSSRSTLSSPSSATINLSSSSVIPTDIIQGNLNPEVLTNSGNAIPSTNHNSNHGEISAQARNIQMENEATSISLCPVCEISIPSVIANEHTNSCIDNKDFKTATTLQEELQIKGLKFLEDEPISFVVRRNNLVKDVMKKLKLFFGDDKAIRPIKVEFVGEPAVDDGGPLREMFSLFYDRVPDLLMYGQEKSFVFRHDVHHLDQMSFMLLGKFLAIGFLMGATGPHNWSSEMISYILGKAVRCSSNVFLAMMLKLNWRK